MQPIYDEFGNVGGWLQGQRVLDRAGADRAVIVRGAVISSLGTHLGFFAGGYFRDHQGAAAAFVAGGRGAAAPPALQAAPRPPAVAEPPPPPAVPALLAAAPPKQTWSVRAWKVFLSR